MKNVTNCVKIPHKMALEWGYHLQGSQDQFILFTFYRDPVGKNSSWSIWNIVAQIVICLFCSVNLSCGQVKILLFPAVQRKLTKWPGSNHDNLLFKWEIVIFMGLGSYLNYWKEEHPRLWCGKILKFLILWMYILWVDLVF